MRGSMLFKIGKLLCTYKWVKRLRRRWHRCRFGRRAAAAAVEYFIGRSLTKIGRGAARPPPPPPTPPSDFRRNEFAAAVGVRTSVPRNTCPWSGSPRNIAVSDSDKSSNPSSTRSVVHRSLAGGSTNPLVLTKGLMLGFG